MPTPIILIARLLPALPPNDGSRDSLNQSVGKVEFCAQLFFELRHLPIVALVIVTAQMQDAVQH
jgi:hypothetical protein